jgi:hypothetical protein
MAKKHWRTVSPQSFLASDANILLASIDSLYNQNTCRKRIRAFVNREETTLDAM